MDDKVLELKKIELNNQSYQSISLFKQMEFFLPSELKRIEEEKRRKEEEEEERRRKEQYEKEKKERRKVVGCIRNTIVTLVILSFIWPKVFLWPLAVMIVLVIWRFWKQIRDFFRTLWYFLKLH